MNPVVIQRIDSTTGQAKYSAWDNPDTIVSRRNRIFHERDFHRSLPDPHSLDNIRSPTDATMNESAVAFQASEPERKGPKTDKSAQRISLCQGDKT